MSVRRKKLTIGGARDQMLVIYHAEPGTPSADRFALLAALTDSPPPKIKV